MPKLVHSKAQEVVHTIELTDAEIRAIFAACHLTASKIATLNIYGELEAWFRLLMNREAHVDRSGLVG